MRPFLPPHWHPFAKRAYFADLPAPGPHTRLKDVHMIQGVYASRVLPLPQPVGVLELVLWDWACGRPRKPNTSIGYTVQEELKRLAAQGKGLGVGEWGEITVVRNHFGPYLGPE